jgi:hypothetical protein
MPVSSGSLLGYTRALGRRFLNDRNLRSLAEKPRLFKTWGVEHILFWQLLPEVLSLTVQIHFFDERYAIDFVESRNTGEDFFQSRFPQAGKAFGFRRTANF